MRPLGLILARFGLVTMLPAPAGAQPPMDVTQRGSFGGGDGPFRDPWGVATVAVGDVHVVDMTNHRIQKFGDATPATSSKATYRD